MATQRGEETATLEASLSDERARLVRLCARLTGDRDAAEDLVQETLLEAWRHRHKLRDGAGRGPWLSAIARNVCLRWGRGRGRTLARVVQPGDGEGAPVPRLEDWPADDADLTVELEREELATLLDRALALLPPATRAVLIERYIHESPGAEVAARLGLSQGAAMKRLQRGTLSLRRVLTTELREEAVAHGLCAPGAAEWRETRIWCPTCGRRRLSGRFDRARPPFILRCPDCRATTGANFAETPWVAALDGVRGFKPALSRLARLATARYRRALATRTARCDACGGAMHLRMGLPSYLPAPARDWPGAHLVCRSCGCTTNQSLRGLALALPEGRAFWRAHPRIRTLPERDIKEVSGHAAIVTGFQSVAGAARLDVVSARDDFRVLGIHPHGA